MNHLNQYKRLIRKAKSRQLIGYSEKHHIIPECLGGSNKSYNKVKLTAREHFIAHLLLWKISTKLYGKDHKYTEKLVYAANQFLYRKANRNAPRIKINGRIYELLKCERNKKLSKRMSGDKNPMYGKKGEDHPAYGTNRSEIHRSAISIAQRGKKQTSEFKEKLFKERAKKFKITYLTGNIEVIYGLNKFCRERKYNHGGLSQLRSGKIKHYKDILKIELYDN